MGVRIPVDIEGHLKKVGIGTPKRTVISDLNTLFDGGAYYALSSSVNNPVNISGTVLHCVSDSPSFATQIYFCLGGAILPNKNRVFVRHKDSDVWEEWHEIFNASMFSPQAPRLVWSGSATSVAMTALSEQGPGFYLVVSNQGTHGIQVNTGVGNCYGGAQAEGLTSGNLRVRYARFTEISFKVESCQVNETSFFDWTITAIYKV